jgi:hypothetical protein
MKQFDYSIQPYPITEDAYKKLGKEGWKLIATQPGSTLVFKREIKPSLAAGH